MGALMEGQTQDHPDLRGRIAAAQKVSRIALPNGLIPIFWGGSWTAPIAWAMLLKALHGSQPSSRICKI